MKRCVRCLLPNTKPDLWFDPQGVCAACLSFDARTEVNWSERRGRFRELMSSLAGQAEWDCVIPASGGKDSTFQVLKVLEEGYRPLVVTSTTCDLTPIGQRNLENLQKLGVDHITVSPNPDVRARLNRIGLEEVGDIAWPEHVGIFTIPVRVAIRFGIPLIVWGENSQNEYGGPPEAASSEVLDRRWLEEFGGLLGMRVSDLERFGIDRKDLSIYTYPSGDELTRAGVRGLFLGHFFPWDGLSNWLVAQAHGFESYPAFVEGSAAPYENLDNFQHGIHDYFKYLKFGFGRATDIASLHVRHGRLSRDEALSVVKARDGTFPWSYLGKDLDSILKPLGIDVPRFQQICDQFTNKALFEKSGDGSLIRRSDLSPVLTEDQ